MNRIVSALLQKAPEIVANKIVSDVERALEPPLVLRKEDVRRGRTILRYLVNADASSDWVRLPGPPGRGAFLSAAVRLLSNKPDEWAIVGLGSVARRSFVREVFVRRGKPGSVGLPVSVQAQIRGHLEEIPGGEIIHIHNHPDGVGRAIKNLVLGNAPVTSDGDREVEQAHSEVAMEAASKTLSERRVRFFVVENGQIHRYWLPSKVPVQGAG